MTRRQAGSSGLGRLSCAAAIAAASLLGPPIPVRGATGGDGDTAAGFTEPPLRIPAAMGAWEDERAAVEEHLKQGELDRALVALRRLLAGGDDALYKVADGRYVASDIAVRGLLSALSPDVKQAFDGRFGAIAREHEEAWMRGETAWRDRLAGEFALTAGGRRAIAWQALEAFEAGDFAGVCDRFGLLRAARADEGGRDAVALGIAAYLDGDLAAYAEARRAAPAGHLESLRARIDRELAGRVRGDARHAAQFDPSPEALPRAPVLRGIVQWRTFGRTFSPSPGSGPAGFGLATVEYRNYAVTYGGRVYAGTSQDCFEFDARTGKLLGRFSDDDFEYAFGTSAERAPQAVVVSDRFVIVSFIVGVEEADQYATFAITKPIPYRRLFAFSRNDRRLVWRSDRLPSLEGLNVAGVPLLRGDVLFVPGWLKEGFINLSVAAVDVATGSVLWKRLVCGSQVQTTMFGEPEFEPFGVGLATCGGNLIAATHMGAIAALRRTDGTIRWLTTYPRLPMETLYSRPAYMIGSLREQWLDNPVFIHRGEIIVAPRDSELLLSLDLASGAITRSHQVKSAPSLPYLLGLRGGKLYRAGGGGIEAFELAVDGFRAATVLRPVTPPAAPPAGAARVAGRLAGIRGRPALTEQGIYCCLGDGLYFCDLDTRATHKVVAWLAREEPSCVGNVSVTPQAVLVTSASNISAYVAAEGGAP